MVDIKLEILNATAEDVQTLRAMVTNLPVQPSLVSPQLSQLTEQMQQLSQLTQALAQNQYATQHQPREQIRVEYRPEPTNLPPFMTQPLPALMPATALDIVPEVPGTQLHPIAAKLAEIATISAIGLGIGFVLLFAMSRFKNASPATSNLIEPPKVANPNNGKLLPVPTPPPLNNILPAIPR